MIDTVFHPPMINSVILKLLPKNLDGISILDCGCGIGEWGFLIRTRLKGKPLLYGVELKKKYYDKIIPLKIYEHVWLDNVLNVDKIFCKDYFDIVMGIEIIEHLYKKDGYRFIKKIEKICRGNIIISTPQGYARTRYHVSGWYQKDFNKLGYETKIVYIQNVPRSLKVLDIIRRKLFKLGNGKYIIATKSL